jgi:protein dithiol oxidoreductase (disulfide-forming)
MRTLSIAAIAALLSIPAVAAPVAGTDYQPINPPQPTSDPSKIVVTEFFSYQCPHCFRFAKPYEEWIAKLPADVKAERVAVSIGHQTWLPAAQAFYALTAMKQVPAIDDALFGAIHRQRLQLDTEAALTNWVGRQGIDQAAFTRAYQSFSVKLNTKRADDLSRSYRLPSVPTLAIDGRYLIPIADDGNFNDQLEIASALIEEARRTRKGR